MDNKYQLEQRLKDIEGFKYLLKERSTSLDSKGFGDLLILIASKNLYELVDTIIEDPIFPDVALAYGDFFFTAVKHGHNQFLFRLLEKGFKPYTMTKAVETAIKHDKFHTAEALIQYCYKIRPDKGFSIDFNTPVFNSHISETLPLLQTAIFTANVPLIKAILNSGVDPNALVSGDEFSKNLDNPITCAVMLFCTSYSKENSMSFLFAEDVVNLLIEKGADIINCSLSALLMALPILQSKPSNTLYNFILKELYKRDRNKYNEIAKHFILDLANWEKNQLLVEKLVEIGGKEVINNLGVYIAAEYVEKLRAHDPLADQYLAFMFKLGLESKLAIDILRRRDNYLVEPWIRNHERLTSLLLSTEITRSDIKEGPEFLSLKISQGNFSAKQLDSAITLCADNLMDECVLVLLAAGANPNNIDKPAIQQIRLESDQDIHPNFYALRAMVMVVEDDKNEKLLSHMLQVFNPKCMEDIDDLRGILKMAQENNNKTMQLYINMKILRELKKFKKERDFDIRILQARQSLSEIKEKEIKQSGSRTYGNLSEEQLKLRKELFEAIAACNKEKIVELVSLGVDPNLAGSLRIDKAYHAEIAGVQYNLTSLTPLQFVMMQMDSNEGQEFDREFIGVYHLLVGLGANMRIADEWSLHNNRKNLLTQFQHNELLVTMINDALKSIPTPKEEAMRDRAQRKNDAVQNTPAGSLNLAATENEAGSTSTLSGGSFLSQYGLELKKNKDNDKPEDNKPSKKPGM